MAAMAMPIGPVRAAITPAMTPPPAEAAPMIVTSDPIVEITEPTMLSTGPRIAISPANVRITFFCFSSRPAHQVLSADTPSEIAPRTVTIVGPRSVTSCAPVSLSVLRIGCI